MSSVDGSRDSLSLCLSPTAAGPLAANPLSPSAGPLSPAAGPLSPSAGPLSPSAAPLSPTGAGKNVYVDGMFDLFHAGHVAFLRGALALGGEAAALVVGVAADDDPRRKRPPVMAHAERVAAVAACRYVTRVVERPPPAPTPEFLREQAIDLVARGDGDRQESRYAAPIAQGIMRYVPRAGPSTADVIRRAAAAAARAPS